MTEVNVPHFTGKYDIDGNEVNIHDVVLCEKGCKHEVIWIESLPYGGMTGFALSNMFPGYSWTGKEKKIGNSIDNPELLTK